MRRDAVVLRTPILLTAAVLAAVVTLSACGSVRMGAAALVGDKRISSATLTSEVNNLDTAYQADKGKIQLQFAASQMPQQVLSWLVRFRVREQLAARNGITVTTAESQQALAAASAQAKQSGANLTELAVANGLPPNQIGELGRYQAIENKLVDRMDGGKLPRSSSALQALGVQFDKSQCLAAKSLGIRVNPQFGAIDYSQLSIVPATSRLSALPGAPSPKPTGTAAPQLTPPC